MSRKISNGFLIIVFIICLAACIDDGILTINPQIPQLDTLIPAEGLVGDEILVQGSNLANVDTLWVDGTRGQIISQSENELRFQITANMTSGPVVAKNPEGATVGPELRIIAQQINITITSASPLIGGSGTQVQINGTDFDQLETGFLVRFNGLSANKSVISPTQINTEVPSGATSGRITILNGTEVISGPIFTVTSPPPSNKVFTLVKDGVDNPFDLVVLGDNVIFSEDQNHRIRFYDISAGTFSNIGTGSPGIVNGSVAQAQFNFPTGLALSDNNSALFIADRQNHLVRAVANANVVTVAGIGQAGFQDGGLQQQAQFNSPVGVVVLNNIVYVADLSNHAIRGIDIQNQSVTTIVGNGTAGFADGKGTVARLNGPVGMVVENANNILIADAQNNSIRRLNVNTQVLSTVAGDGTQGFRNGANNQAQFNNPIDVDIDSKGVIYVADASNHLIRKIENGLTTTFAGSGTAGEVNGDANLARFNLPVGVYVMTDTEILVADYLNGAIRRIEIQ